MLEMLSDSALQQSWRARDLYWKTLWDAVGRADAVLAEGGRIITRPKIGFLILHHYFCMHYQNVWRHLDKADFDLVIFDDGYDYSFYEKMLGYGCNIVFGEDVINSCQQYAVSAGFGCMEMGKRSGYNIARTVASMTPYSLVKYETLPSAHIDLFLSQGDEQDRLCRRFCPEADHAVVGYSRLDNLHACHARIAETKAKFGIVDDRPVLVWMPTHGSAMPGAISLYGAAIADLSDCANIVVKPHFVSFFERPDCYVIRDLINAGRVRVVRDVDDDAELFSIADVMVCDMGGSAFAAIFADKSLVITDVGRADEVSDLERQVRELVPVLDRASIHRLRDFLMDLPILAAQRPALAAMRKRLFADTQGYAGLLAAEVLKARLDEVRRHL